MGRNLLCKCYIWRPSTFGMSSFDWLTSLDRPCIDNRKQANRSRSVWSNQFLSVYLHMNYSANFCQMSLLPAKQQKKIFFSNSSRQRYVHLPMIMPTHTHSYRLLLEQFHFKQFNSFLPALPIWLVSLLRHNYHHAAAHISLLTSIIRRCSTNFWNGKWDRYACIHRLHLFLVNDDISAEDNKGFQKNLPFLPAILWWSFRSADEHHLSPRAMISKYGW